MQQEIWNHHILNLQNLLFPGSYSWSSSLELTWSYIPCSLSLKDVCSIIANPHDNAVETKILLILP